jgi:hypothetical protein
MSKDKMQAKAARTFVTGRHGLAATLLAGLVGVGSAGATELPESRTKQVIRPGKLQTVTPVSRCAQYGEGFVAVVGSESCVKIGGRLRIDLGGAMPAPVYAGSRDGINPAAHVRVSR